MSKDEEIIKKGNLELVENKGKTPLIDDELPIDDNQVYGFDRTRKPKMMLSFRKADKTKLHVPYPQILLVHEGGEGFLTVIPHPLTLNWHITRRSDSRANRALPYGVD